MRVRASTMNRAQIIPILILNVMTLAAFGTVIVVTPIVAFVCMFDRVIPHAIKYKKGYIQRYRILMKE
jgi:hypothetical protein